MSKERDLHKKGQRSFKKTVNPLMSNVGKKVLQKKFFFAVYTRNIPEITRCLSKGVDPNYRSSEYGVTPLHLLAERNDYILGYRLLEYKKFDVDVRSVHGLTALHLTCVFNCKKFALILLEHGANPNIHGRFNITALHISVQQDNYGITIKLLKFGAEVNVVDCFGNTPLSLSIIDRNNYLIAKTLFQNGADMSVEDQRPLHIFFESVLHCRTISQIELVLLLLENGVNINMTEPQSGRNCLHFVALTGFLELAVVLVEKGAHTHTMDVCKRTPIKVAVDHANDIVADYFRKGYRPSSLLTALPKIFQWSNKVKARINERRQAESEKQAELKQK
ncbi:putative ankyrin repeat protein RF_0381 [Tribolium madens]|uniref:putative ankyrin repeat protein RF_0381 n=1 Tax=Tribolium madens TaxID=41895 RepID=UPI001CF76642|nr:putative ankyrin repeat protein RF_0381 [Tribolium madens]